MAESEIDVDGGNREMEKDKEVVEGEIDECGGNREMEKDKEVAESKIDMGGGNREIEKDKEVHKDQCLSTFNCFVFYDMNRVFFLFCITVLVAENLVQLLNIYYWFFFVYLLMLSKTRYNCCMFIVLFWYISLCFVTLGTFICLRN